jgi:hypothetical protein
MQTITILEALTLFLVCIFLYVLVKTIKQYFFDNK